MHNVIHYQISMVSGLLHIYVSMRVWCACVCSLCVCVWCALHHACVCVLWCVMWCVWWACVYMCVRVLSETIPEWFSAWSVSVETCMYTVNYSKFLLSQHFTLQRWFRSESCVTLKLQRSWSHTLTNAVGAIHYMAPEVIWGVCMVVCVCTCVGVWVCGCVGVWVCM